MIVSYEDLPQVRKKHRKERLVMTGGVFDIIHEGHAFGLNHCRQQGDLLVVGLSSDERVKQRKGPQRPIRGELGRLMLVDALKPVDYAFIMPMPTEDTPTVQAIKRLRPDVYMDNIENYEKWLPHIEEVEALGTQFMFNTSQRLASTSSIIRDVINAYAQRPTRETILNGAVYAGRVVNTYWPKPGGVSYCGRHRPICLGAVLKDRRFTAARRNSCHGLP